MKYPEVARRMQMALDMNHMKAQELADKTGIGKSSISHYVTGSHCPSNITAGKMATVLNVDPVWLMGFDVKIKSPEDQALADVALIKKFNSLNDRDKALVMNMIDTLLNSYE